MRKDNFEVKVKIAERAEQLDLLAFDRTSLLIDLEVAEDEFNLRFEDLYDADNFNFAHDIVGIQNHIDRSVPKMTGLFLPRFSGQQ